MLRRCHRGNGPIMADDKGGIGMGLHKVTAYVIQCDVCKTFYPGPDGQGCMFFNTKERAERELDEIGHWRKKDGKLACENCHEEL